MYSTEKDGLQDGLKPENMQEKLSQAYRLLQYVIENDRSAIALLNRDLRYIYVSKRFISVYKVMEKDVLGKLHYDIFPDVSDSWKEVYKRALNGEVICSDEDSFERKDGTRDLLRWECRPWYEVNGSVGGIILYTDVICPQKESDLELIKEKEKAVATQKDIALMLTELKATKAKAEESDLLKTSFLQNMSHEVRTPLNSIVGFSQLLSEPGLPLQKIKSYSKIISTNSTRLIGIISDVIEVSRIHSGQAELTFTKFDVVSLINRVVDSTREILQLKEVDLMLDQNISGDHSVIISDSGKMEKIFSHLIDNAVKFTHNGSIRIKTEIKNEKLQFSVYDTGIGIAQGMLKIIFDPFRQLETGLNRKYGGTGLGLTIVRAYVDTMKGTLLLKSKLGKGTNIDVSLPISMESKQLSDNKPDALTDHIKILIAEDEYSNFQYLYEVLHPEGFEILHAHNGQEAIEMCRKIDDIKLVLMDLKMPVLDGASAAKQIRKFRPDLPIIVQTAYFPEPDKMKVFDDLISKPVRMNDLKEKVNHYLIV